MKLLIAYISTVWVLVLSGCATPMSLHNLSSHYNKPSISAELYHRGKLLELDKYAIHDVQHKAIVIFSPGVRGSYRVQQCRPTRLPTVLNAIDRKPIAHKTVLVFKLCSYSTENHLTKGTLHKKRAKEMDLAVNYFLKKGIAPKNIMVAGQSWGGWTALYYMAKYKPNILGAIAFAPGFWGNRKHKVQHLYEQDIALFQKSHMRGMVLSHPKDRFFPTVPYHNFVNHIAGLMLVKVGERCQVSKGAHRAHGFIYWCNHYNKQIIEYIEAKLNKD